jgi:hypothetical protein
MSACHIERGETARICHQVPHRLGKIHGAVTPQAGMLRLSPAAPQRVVETIDAQYFGVGKRLIVGLCFAESTQQGFPSMRAW